VANKAELSTDNVNTSPQTVDKPDMDRPDIRAVTADIKVVTKMGIKTLDSPAAKVVTGFKVADTVKVVVSTAPIPNSTHIITVLTVEAAFTGT
jgi:hypothetical protein